ncbi:MAG: dienelactone hydrolase family protein [Burkholderiales bacterium]
MLSNTQHEDLMALTTNKPHWSRRDFMSGSIASGFALAAQPICAQTMIQTDTLDLEHGMVQVPTDSGNIPAYYAMPSRAALPPMPSSIPIVLVVQEIFGVHEHIKDVARRFAKAGYLAVAPELYYRQGDVSQLKDNKEIFAKVVSKVPDWQVMRDLDASVRWAEKNGGSRYKLGITGFCWGGRITWLYTAHNDYVKAGVAWYGRLVGDKNAMTPTNPIDVVSNIKAPVLGLYGGADAGIPNNTVAQMNAALKKAGNPSIIHTYPDTPHAFHADYRPSYRQAEAWNGWDRCLAWFKANGVA